MTRAELIAKIRFLFSDTPTANTIFREPLTARPGNIIDGNNRIFFLLNKRISTTPVIYDGDNVAITAFTVDATSGKIIFDLPPTTRLFADYAWQKLTDAELDNAIDLAAASGNFDADNVPPSLVDYAVHYCLANCYTVAASKAAEYYTMSASGKQVSKSELFNHYTRLADSFMASAQKLRTDSRTDRGDRDIPAGEVSASDFSNPYFPEDGGL